MHIRVLVLNPGSATLKIAVAETGDADPAILSRDTLEWPSAPERDAIVESILERMAADREPDVVGMRVVHGGDRYTRPVLVDSEVEDEIERLRPLAPFHNAAALALLAAARRRFAAIPIVAVFDTAFHASRPAASMRYALPLQVARAAGIGRSGFHGIAHESLAHALARACGSDPESIDAVTLQLGAGCSACAIAGGRSIETSMGFTPLEGLVMATRSGDVDPGAVLHLARRLGLDEVEDLLRHRSGLLGLAGTADMREVLERAGRGDDAAELAVEIFVRRIVMTVGAYLTLLQGRGAIVFGGGIGARSMQIRARVAERLSAWDVRLDPVRNAVPAPGQVHVAGARPVYAFETDEEGRIARHAASVFAGPAEPSA